jgi:hypothetical protein
VTNSLTTSVARLKRHRSTIAACFVLWRKFSRTAFWDFCNTICQQQTYPSQHNDDVVTPQAPNQFHLQPELADPPPDGMFPAALKEDTMSEAKLAPNLPDWMVEHANRYLASGGTDGHMYKAAVPRRGEITAPALLLTTTGRKSGDKFIFPLFYGTDGGSYFVIASKGGAPQHPG